MRRFATGVVLSTIAAGAASASGDEIELFGGEVRRGVVVTDETAAQVTFEPADGGSPQTLQSSRVRAIVHDRTSDAFRAASEFEAAGRFGEAASLYLAAARAPVRSVSWERQYGLFRAAECRRLEGRGDTAASLLRDLLEGVPLTRFRGEASERLARIALGAGDVATARATLERLRDEAVRAGLGRRWQLRAELRLQQIDEAKDPDAALRSYVAFESRAVDFPDVKNLARVRAGRLRLLRGQHERALAFFSDAFAEREPLEVEIAAGACNGLALCRASRPGAGDDDHRAALEDFLRTVVHYGPRLGHDDLMAEALLGAAREFHRRGGAEDRKRASELAQRCRKEYPGTTWAQQAAEFP